MAAWWAAVLCLALLPLVPGVQAAPAALRMDDPAGDVLEGGAATGVDARTVDIVELVVGESGSDLHADLRLAEAGPADLLAIGAAPTVYQVGFVGSANHAGYLLTATNGGLADAALPGFPSLTAWTYAVVDRSDGSSTPVLGRLDDEGVHWTVPLADLGLGAGSVLGRVTAEAWTSPQGSTQRADGAAAGKAGYEVGRGPVEVGYEPDFEASGSWTAFTDESGDVTGGRPAGEAAADVLAARLADDGTQLLFELELRSLADIDKERSAPGFHAQYALCFHTVSEFCMRATYRDGWEFSIHDVARDDWPEAEGYAIGDSLTWYIPYKDVRAAEGTTLDGWGIQSWNSYDNEEQYGDGASGSLTAFTVGQDAPQLPQPPPPPPPTAPTAEGGDGRVMVEDPRGDVDSRGDSYAGPGAPATDVLRAIVWEEGEVLLFQLDLADLSTVGDEPDDGNYHVQYALSFVVWEGHQGFSMRASYSGSERSRSDQGEWSFSLHDRQEDEWPKADASIVGSALVWRMPRSAMGLQAGDVLRQWDVSTWASFEVRDQFGDDAAGSFAFTVGSVPPDGAMAAVEAGDEGSAAGLAEEIAGGVPARAPPATMGALLLAMGAGAVALRRLRP